MVWPFRKKGKDIIDLTYLSKRGLLKLPEKEEHKEISQDSVSSQESESGLGFLGAMASSAEAGNLSSKSRAISPNKIEDIEYKLEVISKRVNAMIDRLDLVEKKLSRDLRQAGN